MQNYVISSVIAALVSLVCVLGLQFAQEAREPVSLSTKSDDLALAIRKNIDSIAAVRSEVSEIRAQLSRKYDRIGNVEFHDENVDPVSLSRRIEVVEKSIAKLEPPDTVSGKKYHDELEQRLNETSQLSIESSSYYQNQSELAEIDFEADSGLPLGNYSDTIDQALQTVEAIEVSDLACGESMCKVTYVKPESSDAEHGSGTGYEVVDKLAQAADGRAVEVRYGTDSSGDKVMYIQLR